ncbi:MAG: hypothetical protein ONB55_22375 [candidate division KSB1 bacterium]|nr:hypothetical protein [candidate division KSB1 bacterium]
MFHAGIDPTRVDTEAKWTPGSVAFQSSSSGTKGFVYAQADGAVTAASYVVAIDGSTYDAVMVTTSNGAPGQGMGKMVGVAQAAMADNEYGWFQIFGPGTVRVAALCAAYTLLNTTATSGQIDDDATAGSRVIDGIVLDASNGELAGAVACFINWPRVARTL